MNNGYIKLHRKTMESDLIGRDLKTVGLFAYLLMRVNWKAGKVRGEWVHPGAAITSIHNLSEALHESPKVIRRCLSELEEDGIITKNNWANRGTKISICNWARYQSLPCLEGRTEGTPEGTPEGTQYKKLRIKEDNNPPNPPGGRSRFEDFWSVYPRKKSKKPAKDKWRRKKLDAKADMIIADIKERMAKDKQWRDGYIPHASTYISQERWEDEIELRGKQPSLPAGYGGNYQEPGENPLEKKWRESQEKMNNGNS